VKTFDELLEELGAPCPPASGPISKSEADKFVKTWNSTLKSVFGADFRLSTHFVVDRLNDRRNKPQISICELTFVLNKFFKKFASQFKQDVEDVKNNIAKGRGKNKDKLMRNEFEYVISSRSTGINFVFALKQDRNTKGTALMLPITVMRKKGFGVNKGEQIVVEDLDTVIDKDLWFEVD
jgi:hypothetical protein